MKNNLWEMTNGDLQYPSKINFKQLGEIIAQNYRDNSHHIETCVIEEMSELTKAVCKNQRNRGDINNTREELGHVMLMCYALMIKYEIDENEVINEAEKAVQKMKDQTNMKMPIDHLDCPTLNQIIEELD